MTRLLVVAALAGWLGASLGFVVGAWWHSVCACNARLDAVEWPQDRSWT